MNTPESIPGSTFRAVARLILLIGAILVLLPVCAVAVFLTGLAGERFRYRTVMALTPVVCGTMAWLIGVRFHLVGRRSRDARVFVANHVSYLDILVAGVAVGGVFVSRHDVKDWPVIGLFARMAGTVFIDRSSLRSAIASSAGLMERASQGIRIILFPEGMTTSGEGVGSFKPFLFGAVAEGSFPVQPLTIRYTNIGEIPITPENKDLVNWYNPSPELDEHGWRLLRLKNVHVTVIFHDPVAPPHSSDKNAVREFAEELQKRVASGMEKTGRGVESSAVHDQ